MKRLSFLVAGLFLLQPLSALATYDAFSDLLSALEKDTSPRSVTLEMHARTDMAGEPAYLSVWANGRVQGALEDRTAEIAATGDMAMPQSGMKARIKLRMRVVDDMMYFTVDSLAGNVGAEEIGTMVEEMIGKWFSTPFDIPAGQMKTDWSALDTDAFHLARTTVANGYSYSLTVDDSLLETATEDVSALGVPLSSKPAFNFHAVIDTDANDHVGAARAYLSLTMEGTSFVAQMSSVPLAAPFTVRVPANATPMETWDSPVGEGSAVPRTATSNAKYEARAAARALRMKTVKKPVSKIAGDILSYGEESAPVTITEYTDYECPFCRNFQSKTLPSIKKDYIDTGKVRLVIRQFPLSQIHDGALPAAMAVQCALDQGNDLGRRANEAMWVLQDVGNELTASNIRKYVGMFSDIDYKAFSDCFDGNEKQAVIDAQIREGYEAGVNGTPSFVLTNRAGASQTILGAYPYETFQVAIDALLK